MNVGTAQNRIVSYSGIVESMESPRKPQKSHYRESMRFHGLKSKYRKRNSVLLGTSVEKKYDFKRIGEYTTFRSSIQCFITDGELINGIILNDTLIYFENYLNVEKSTNFRTNEIYCRKETDL